MPLTNKQRAALEAKAKEADVDAAKLIAAAESMTADGDANKGGAATPENGASPKEKPNLYMYLLPFVTVNEVRTIWLELGKVAGGEEFAGTWAAKQGAPKAEPSE